MLEGSLIPSKLATKSVINNENNENQSTAHDKDKNNKSDILSLSEYLTKGESEYEEFAQFLTKSFALENLLYVVRSLTFRHKILKQLQLQTVNVTQDQSAPNGKFWQKVFKLKFDYLKPVKGENRMETVSQIAQNIYDQFICDQAPYQINIPYDIKETLDSFFNNDEINNYTLQDYLIVFNDSIQAVYQILMSVYQFQYKSKKKISGNDLV